MGCDMTRLTLLHTADAHVEYFATLVRQMAPDAELHQEVHPAWLARAQQGDGALHADIAQAVATHRQAGQVMCTCSTIGPMAEAAGALRVDRPMMAQAAAIGGTILLVYALASTRQVSAELLQDELQKSGRAAVLRPLDLTAFWPLFEAGEITAFRACVASAVRVAHSDSPVSAVVLAQVSMAEAAPMLTDLGVPVLAAPQVALRGLLAPAP